MSDRPGADVVFPRPHAHSSEPWLRQREAAVYLGVSRETLRRWHKAGLPVHRVQGVALYRKTELDTWVRQQGATASGRGRR